jgi:23S rRNA pseudouridine2605 synthase
MRRPVRKARGGRAAPRRAEPGKATLSLARALSKFGVCSRSEAVRRIESGRVRVNGAPALSAARRIDPRRDRVTVDGVAASDATPRLVLALHKPVGYVTTRVDPAGRPTVYDLVKDVSRWVFPVGRLDRDSSGLLILTNDHQLGNRLSDPEQHLPKTYHAQIDGVPEEAALRVLRQGVPLPEGKTTRPARVSVLGVERGGSAWLELVLTEGRNRQVRRMCGAVGHDVLTLVRVRIGGLELGDLPPGAWRRLEADEIARLLERA